MPINLKLNHFYSYFVSNSPKKIIIDTDLSLGEFSRDVDDGLALIMALNSPEIDVVGILAVYGNTKLKNVVKNLSKLKALFPEKIKFPKLITGAIGPESWKKKQKLKGIQQLAEIIAKNSGEISLVPIGPLTNVALLFYHYPDTLWQLKELIIMGGKINGWEFNFASDPLATDFVLHQSIPTYIFGLEVCTAQKFTAEHYNQLKEKCTPRARYIVKGIRSWLVLNRAFTGNGKNSGFFPFDATAIAYLIKPEIYHTVLCPAYHVHGSRLNFLKFNPLIQTKIEDYWNQRKSLPLEKKNTWVHWALKINSDGFMKLMLDRLF
jgi:inosine-uridine nucleoside N-ribohydrolase